MATGNLDGIRALMKNSLFMALNMDVSRPSPVGTLRKPRKAKYLYVRSFRHSFLEYGQKVGIDSVHS